uniref:Uncharacterized protein n=1 Tax=Sphaerodactylus townsendi TaxID=933632 RepID=A0ACB8E7A0_9SAUR
MQATQTAPASSAWGSDWKRAVYKTGQVPRPPRHLSQKLRPYWQNTPHQNAAARTDLHCLSFWQGSSPATPRSRGLPSSAPGVSLKLLSQLEWENSQTLEHLSAPSPPPPLSLLQHLRKNIIITDFQDPQGSLTLAAGTTESLMDRSAQVTQEVKQALQDFSHSTTKQSSSPPSQAARQHVKSEARRQSERAVHNYG